MSQEWDDLVTAAMLGTDRRPPPEIRPAAIGDLVDDALLTDGAERLLTAVAAAAAVRRAGFLPADPVARLVPPDGDERSLVPPDAVEAWRAIVTDWPVLDDEWLIAVIDRGFRLPADVLVTELARTRSDAVRRSRVALAGGPLAGWVVDHLPAFEPVSARAVPADEVTSLPELPVPPDLADLLTADARTVARRIGAGLVDGSFGPPHRGVLVNLVARCRPAVLVDLAGAAEASSTGLGTALADLARLRRRGLASLGVPT